jgi:hypothetical protein
MNYSGFFAGYIYFRILRGRCRHDGIKLASFQPLMRHLSWARLKMLLMIKRRVQTLLDKGAFTKAIGAAAEYVRRNPECAAGHQLVAMAEEAAGYTKAAIQTILHAIDLAPEELSFRVMRARLLVKDHRVKEAIADVEAIITMCNPRRDAELLHDALICRDELRERLALTPVQRKHQQTTGTCVQSVV